LLILSITVLNSLNKHLGNKLNSINASKTDGPAHNFRIKGTNSTVGIISAVSNHFCQTCNRVRLTAKGDLILCLGQEDAISLKDAVRSDLTNDEIKNMIVILSGKWHSPCLSTNFFLSCATVISALNIISSLGIFSASLSEAK
jgi:molybdenum cofactor biosynthesis enzyme MoaA